MIDPVDKKCVCRHGFATILEPYSKSSILCIPCKITCKACDPLDLSKCTECHELSLGLTVNNTCPCDTNFISDTNSGKCL